MKYLFIALGGALGSVLRYLVAGWSQQLTRGAFPIGTLVVNVIGCFLIGLAGAAFAGPILIREDYRIGLIIGLLGGFTTFSAFGFETFSMANEGLFSRAALNLLGSNVLGLAAVWIGYRAAHKWIGV